jgi:hypothetical protein
MTVVHLRLVSDAPGCLRMTLGATQDEHRAAQPICYQGSASVGFDHDGAVASLDLFDVPSRLEQLARPLDRTAPTMSPGQHGRLDWWLDAGWAWFPVSLAPSVTSARGRGQIRLLVRGAELTEVSLSLHDVERRLA